MKKFLSINLKSSSSGNVSIIADGLGKQAEIHGSPTSMMKIVASSSSRATDIEDATPNTEIGPCKEILNDMVTSLEEESEGKELEGESVIASRTLGEEDSVGTQGVRQNANNKEMTTPNDTADPVEVKGGVVPT